MYFRIINFLFLFLSKLLNKIIVDDLIHKIPSKLVLDHHLSHLSPPVLSLQLMQAPVLWSHWSACPLHWQGRQLGKPQ